MRYKLVEIWTNSDKRLSPTLLDSPNNKIIPPSKTEIEKKAKILSQYNIPRLCFVIPTPTHSFTYIIQP